MNNNSVDSPMKNAHVKLIKQAIDHSSFVCFDPNLRFNLWEKEEELKECVETIRAKISPAAEIGYGDIPYYEDQVMHLEADISRLTEDTGWEPQTSFEKGIKKTIEFMLKERT